MMITVIRILDFSCFIMCVIHVTCNFNVKDTNTQQFYRHVQVTDCKLVQQLTRM